MNTEQDIQNLVIERLRTLPENREISIGANGDFTKYDLIRHVEANDDVGQKIVQIEMSFLRGLKEGPFYVDEMLSNQA